MFKYPHSVSPMLLMNQGFQSAVYPVPFLVHYRKVRVWIPNVAGPNPVALVNGMMDCGRKGIEFYQPNPEREVCETVFLMLHPHLWLGIKVLSHSFRELNHAGGDWMFTLPEDAYRAIQAMNRWPVPPAQLAAFH